MQMTNTGRFYWSLSKSDHGLHTLLASGTLSEVLAARDGLDPVQRRRSRISLEWQAPDYSHSVAAGFTVREARQLLQEGGTC